MSSKWTTLAEWQDPEYGWVTANPNEQTFNGFQQAADLYKQTYGKDVDKRWMDFDITKSPLNRYDYSAYSRNGTTPRSGLTNSGINLNLKTMPQEVDSSLMNWFEAQKAGTASANDASIFSSGRGNLNINGMPKAPNPYSVYNSNNNTYTSQASGNPDPQPTQGQRARDLLGLNRQTTNWQGNNISDKQEALWNPNYYDDPELQRYFDSPNASFHVENRGGYPIWGPKAAAFNNDSWNKGGELLKDEVAQWFAKQANDPSTYGDFSRYENTSDPLIQKLFFNKDGQESSYYYTPYDYAISGVAGSDSNGYMANQELDFWDPKNLYTPGSQFTSSVANPLGLKSTTDRGFLSTVDPTLGGAKNLGNEDVRIRHRLKEDSGLFGGGLLGSLAKMGISNFIPGASLVFAAHSLGSSLGKNPIDPEGILRGYAGPDGQPTFNFTGQRRTDNGGEVVDPYNPGGSAGGGGTTGGGTTGGGTAGGNGSNTGNGNNSVGQTFRWNNIDFGVRGGGNNYSLYTPEGQLAYDMYSDTGTDGLEEAFKTYLGTL